MFIFHKNPKKAFRLLRKTQELNFIKNAFNSNFWLLPKYAFLNWFSLWKVSLALKCKLLINGFMIKLYSTSDSVNIPSKVQKNTIGGRLMNSLHSGKSERKHYLKLFIKESDLKCIAISRLFFKWMLRADRKIKQCTLMFIFYS